MENLGECSAMRFLVLGSINTLFSCVFYGLAERRESSSRSHVIIQEETLCTRYLSVIIVLWLPQSIWTRSSAFEIPYQRHQTQSKSHMIMTTTPQADLQTMATEDLKRLMNRLAKELAGRSRRQDEGIVDNRDQIEVTGNDDRESAGDSTVESSLGSEEAADRCTAQLNKDNWEAKTKTSSPRSPRDQTPKGTTFLVSW